MGSPYLSRHGSLVVFKSIIRVMMLLTTSTITLSVLGMASASCSVSSPVVKVDANDPVAYKDTCIVALEKQVRIEFEAALQYILMAAHFDQDTVNLPNIAAMFWTHADEERTHAIEFIKYLRMRGAENNDFFSGEPLKPREGRFDWTRVEDALQLALKMEKDVTARMQGMIDICSQDGLG